VGVSFPLQNIRKTVDCQWYCLHITNESITVPLTGSYPIVRLIEVPSNGSISGTTKPSISGLLLINSYPPSASEFWCNYATGDLVFNSNESGNTYIVDYWAKGSLVEAEDINYIYETLSEHTSAAPHLPYYITESGSSPNKIISTCFKNENNQEIILSTTIT
jgi:hypothetical protein